MTTAEMPKDIRNFLAACGTAEAMRRATAGQRKKAWRYRLGVAVRRRREQLGLTHGQLAAAMGRRKAAPSIANLEAGKSTWLKCWNEMMARLAAALDTTREALEQEAA